MIKSDEGEVVLSGDYLTLFSEYGQVAMALKEMMHETGDEELIEPFEKDMLFAMLADNEEEYFELTKMTNENKLKILRKVIKLLGKKEEDIEFDVEDC